MTGQVAALVESHLSDRRRSLLAWGLPLGLWSGFVVAIYPSVEDALSSAVQNYPEALKEAFGIGELTTVAQYLNAEMLSLIAPLAVGYLAARAVASGLSGAAESGRLDVLLSAPVSRPRLIAAGFMATAVELAIVLALALALTMSGSALAGAGLSFTDALAGFASVWPLGLFTAGVAVIATGWSLRTSIVTGVAAGALVTMYVLDLVGRLDSQLDELRYASVFKYYGNAITDGLDATAFAGLTVVGVALAAVGAWLFQRRDLAG
jgi:ABC-2 type transport system permease protein